MNSSPKQNPLRWRTTAIIRKRYGISNSTSSRSPGFSQIPAYNSIPPSLNSVPRPGTMVVENPFVTATRSGRSTGCRCHRRVLGEGGILADDDRKWSSAQITKVKQALLLRWVVVVAKSRVHSKSPQNVKSPGYIKHQSLQSGIRERERAML